MLARQRDFLFILSKRHLLLQVTEYVQYYIMPARTKASRKPFPVGPRRLEQIHLMAQLSVYPFWLASIMIIGVAPLNPLALGPLIPLGP